MGNAAGALPTPPPLSLSSHLSKNLETFSLLWLDENVNSNKKCSSERKTSDCD